MKCINLKYAHFILSNCCNKYKWAHQCQIRNPPEYPKLKNQWPEYSQREGRRTQKTLNFFVWKERRDLANQMVSDMCSGVFHFNRLSFNELFNITQPNVG